MKNGVVLDSRKIVDKAFSVAVHGYSPREVDEFLDIVATDYETYEQNLNKAIQESKALKNKNDDLIRQNSELEAKVAILNNKLASISDNTEVSRSNLDLLNRIKVLESALHKAGIDPTKI